jgi:hypothetical protein
MHLVRSVSESVCAALIEEDLTLDPFSKTIEIYRPLVCRRHPESNEMSGIM